MQKWPDRLQVNSEFGGNFPKLLTDEMRIWASYPFLGEKEGAAVYGDKGQIVIGRGKPSMLAVRCSAIFPVTTTKRHTFKNLSTVSRVEIDRIRIWKRSVIPRACCVTWAMLLAVSDANYNSIPEMKLLSMMPICERVKTPRRVP